MKLTLADVAAGYNLQNINDNFDKIIVELNDKVLYRNNPVGEPNQLESDIDANSKRIYNLPAPSSDSEAARLQDVRNAIAGANKANLIGVDTITQYPAATTVQGALKAIADSIADGSVGSSANISFITTGTGALSTTVQEALRQGLPLQPEWFGADPTGVADSTAALQKMADAASGKIDMRGTFKINRSILFTNKANVVLQGPGSIVADKTTWAFTPGYRGMVEFVSCTDSGVRDMSITGVRKSNPAAAQPWEDGDSSVELLNCTNCFVYDSRVGYNMAWGIVAVASNYTKVANNLIKDITRQSGINIAVGGGKDCKAWGNTVENVGLYGLEVETAEPSVGGRYYSNTVRNCQKGIALVANNLDTYVYNNTVENNYYGVSVNNTGNLNTRDIVITENNLLRNWTGFETAGARETKIANNLSTHIVSPTYFHRSSYNSVHTVVSSNTFTAINFLNDAAATPVSSTIQILGVTYTITAITTSAIALYGAISTITVTPALPTGLSEGEMFSTLGQSSTTVGYISAIGGTLVSVFDNYFKDAALVFQLRGTSTQTRLDNNHSVDCATLVWFDTANVGGYKMKGNTHTGSIAAVATGSLSSFSGNGDIEGRKENLFAFTKAAAGLSKMYYPASDKEFVFAVTLAITDSSSTGNTVVQINGVDVTVFVPGEYVASGVALKTIYLATPVTFNANTAYTIGITDTVGNLAFKAGHLTLHIV
jgi:hypothetical protein